MINKEILKGILAENILEIEFSKKNGEMRHMICSRNPKHIPEVTAATPVEDRKKKRAESPDVMAVWDIEKEGWRSFNISSITRVQLNSIDILQELDQ